MYLRQTVVAVLVNCFCLGKPLLHMNFVILGDRWGQRREDLFACEHVYMVCMAYTFIYIHITLPPTHTHTHTHTRTVVLHSSVILTGNDFRRPVSTKCWLSFPDILLA